MRFSLPLALAVAAALSPVHVHAQPSWAVAARPAFDISGQFAPDGTVLEGPIGGAITSIGNLVVADARGSRLLVFDGAGRWVRRIGRSGGGPGEFRGIWWIGRCSADTLVVWDRQAAKLSHVSPEGELLRQVTAPFSPQVVSRTSAVACSRTGSYALLSLPMNLRPAPNGISRGPSVLTIFDPARGERAFPAPVTSGELVVRGGGGMPRPLGLTTTVVLDAQRVVVGTADSGHVAVYTLDGRPTGNVRVPERRRAITTAEYHEAVEELANMVPPNARSQVTSFLRELAAPSHTAPYYGMHLDVTGALWLRTSTPVDAVTRFAIYDGAGRPIGQLEIPRRVDVWDIGADYVLGYYLDDIGEPHVVSYRFARR